MHRALAALLLLALTGCTREAQQAAQEQIQPAAEQATATVVEVAVPAVVAVREAVQEAVSLPPPAEPLPDPMVPLATALIVRWEVTSPAYYTQRLQGVICPGGASGPTWGLGWDGGHQTQRDNREAWAQHNDVDRLAGTSGQTGDARCRASRSGLLDVRTAYPMAEAVFARFALPRYRAICLRKYGQVLLDQTAGVQAALVSECYNRGGAIRGDRGTEQAFIRDTCLPARDAECTATQLEKMCRLWQGTPNGPGLCARRFDEARVARSAP